MSVDSFKEQVLDELKKKGKLDETTKKTIEELGEILAELEELEEEEGEDELNVETRKVLEYLKKSEEDADVFPINSPYATYLVIPVAILRRYARIVGPQAILVYLNFLSFTHGRLRGKKEVSAHLSTYHWADLCGISRPTFTECVRRLQAVGLVEIDDSSYRRIYRVIIPNKRGPKPPKAIISAVKPLPKVHPLVDHVKQWNIPVEQPTKDMALIEYMQLKHLERTEQRRASQFTPSSKKFADTLKRMARKRTRTPVKRVKRIVLPLKPGQKEE